MYAISIRKRARVAVFLLALTAPAIASAAPPSASDLATARELYTSGMDALDAGKPADAVEKLAAAWQIAPTPIIGVALARAEEKIGHLVEARETALAIGRLETVHNETARSAQARAEAEKIEEDLAHRIAHLHVVVSRAPEGATAAIDGATVPIASLAVDRLMNPGPHKIELVWDGRAQATATVDLKESERKEVTIEAPLVAPPVTAPPPLSTMPAPQEAIAPAPTPIPAAPPSTAASKAFWAGGITLGVGVTLGTIFGALALKQGSIVTQNCTVNRVCQTPYVGNLSSAVTDSTVSTVSFVVAGVGGALIIAGLIVNHGHAKDHARFDYQSGTLRF